VTGNQIKIGPLASTMMACSVPEVVMEQEIQYLAAIQNATTYLVGGKVLELRGVDGALMADFSQKK
jgi:heat shock protein HslJ